MEFRKGHFLSDYLSEQKLKQENENENQTTNISNKQQISLLNDLLYRLNNIISGLNEMFVVLIFIPTFLFHFCFDKYRKAK